MRTKFILIANSITIRSFLKQILDCWQIERETCVFYCDEKEKKLGVRELFEREIDIEVRGEGEVNITREQVNRLYAIMKILQEQPITLRFDDRISTWIWFSDAIV